MVVIERQEKASWRLEIDKTNADIPFIALTSLCMICLLVVETLHEQCCI